MALVHNFNTPMVYNAFTSWFNMPMNTADTFHAVGLLAAETLQAVFTVAAVLLAARIIWKVVR